MGYLVAEPKRGEYGSQEEYDGSMCAFNHFVQMNRPFGNLMVIRSVLEDSGSYRANDDSIGMGAETKLLVLMKELPELNHGHGDYDGFVHINRQ